MRTIVIFLIVCLPFFARAQNSGQGGLVYVNFKPAVTGTSGDLFFRLNKNPTASLFDRLPPEVTGISADFYFRFGRKEPGTAFIVGESKDFAIVLLKNKPAETLANIEKKPDPPVEVVTRDESKVVQTDVSNPQQKAEAPKNPPPSEQNQIKPDVKSESATAAVEKKEEKKTVSDAGTQPDVAQRETNKPNSNNSVASQVAEAPPPAQPDPLTKDRQLPRYYALIIGVSNYKFSGPEIPNLARPALDASQLSQTLANNYHFRKEDIILMKDASRADIIDGLDELGSKLTEKDNLLIFYAGHGFWDENFEIGYWLPADASPTKKSSWISNSTIKDYIGGFKTKHTLLITDACFSGSIFKVREVDVLTDVGTSKLYQLPSRKAMTSGNLKTVPDNSKFFEYMNKRLLENEDLYLSARQLFQNFFVAVINNTNTVPQYGVIQETGDEGGEFIFIRKQSK